jgi:hypothetical protein
MRSSPPGAVLRPIPWYANLLEEPLVMIQDGPEPRAYTVREVSGEERAVWWERAVAVFPTTPSTRRPSSSPPTLDPSLLAIQHRQHVSRICRDFQAL